ncbi:MAG: hypothetical protein WBM69_24105 [Desulfobacterales bacterium]
MKAHAVIVGGLVDDPGSLRRGPIGVVRENDIFHEAPHWEKVASMMQTLFHYLNESADKNITERSLWVAIPVSALCLSLLFWRRWNNH